MPFARSLIFSQFILIRKGLHPVRNAGLASTSRCDPLERFSKSPSCFKKSDPVSSHDTMVLDIQDFITERGGDPNKIRESQRRRHAPDSVVDDIIAMFEDHRKS